MSLKGINFNGETIDIPSEYLKSITIQNNTVIITDADNVQHSFSVGGSSITVDSQLSDSSQNPVQNRVVKAAIDAKQDKFVELTSSQYDTLINDGEVTIGGITYEYDSSTYYIITDGTTPSGGGISDVRVDNVSIVVNNIATLQTINGDYDATTNKLATQNDLPADITITTTSGSESISDGTNTLSFGSNAFTSTSIPTTYVSTVNGDSGTITNVEKTTNKVTSVSSSSTDTEYPTAKLLYDQITNVTEIAKGKTRNIVISDAITGTNVVNTSFNSTNDTITITITSNKITDIESNDINLSDLKVGDIVSITETDVPDRWVGSIANAQIIFYKLETKLNIDSNPTSASTNPVSSGGVYTALTYKMDKSNPTCVGSFSLNREENTTIGTNSFAAGYHPTASGSYSYAEGNQTIASGNCSHAEGMMSTASGDYSHAEGQTSIASGQASHAEGTGTRAQRKSQHTFGEYNKLDTGGTDATTRGYYIEIVGNGTNALSKSNARTLDWSGNEWLAGKITPVGGISDGNNANYELQIPDTTNWTADKTIATTDQIPSGLPTTSSAGQLLKSTSTSGTVEWGTGLPYSTTAPTAANTDGIKIVVLTSEPATKYDGWLYIIT